MNEKRLLPVRGPEFRRFSGRVELVLSLTSRLNTLPFDEAEERARLLAEIFGRPLPDGVRIYPPFYTDHGLNTEFVGRAFVNQGCTFSDVAPIRIGANVMIAPKVNLITSGHPVSARERHQFVTAAPIVIEDDVWIGAAVTVLPGVTIGRGAAIGAGAVVAKDVPADSLITGPAAALRRPTGG